MKWILNDSLTTVTWNLTPGDFIITLDQSDKYRIPLGVDKILCGKTSGYLI